MVEQKGIVIQVCDDMAEIEALRGSACGSCSVQGGCATAAVARLLPRRRRRLWLRNTLGAMPGDVVLLGMRDGDVVGLSAAVYLVPVLAMLLGAGAGEVLVRAFAMTSELPVIVAAAVALVLGLRLPRRMSRGTDAGDRIVLLRKEPKGFAVVTPN